MGKKNKKLGDSSLGRSLIKDRFGHNKGKKMVSSSMLHTTEIQDGYDWGRLNLQSVTEESSFQEFLSTAELAGTEFQAEKLNIEFATPQSRTKVISVKEMETAKKAHEKFKTMLKIPRRPPWNSETTPEELDKNEREHFLEWRRSLAQLQEKEGILLTPYEKNLEFWRQLWRVVERSDVIVQIVDARNPLLFRCRDLEKYVKEVSEDKINLILVNKADFLTESQREAWTDYFSSEGIQVAFFSALLAAQESKEDEKREEETEETVESREQAEEIEDFISEVVGEEKETNSESADKQEDEHLNEDEKDDEQLSEDASKIELMRKHVANLENAVESNADSLNKLINKIEEIIRNTNLTEEVSTIMEENSSKLLSREELIDLFRTIHQGPKVTKDVTTIGLVGYPNVGKSSTINTLMTCKKVSVSATPGKTKHFQTLYLDKNLLLCDCPGLVMPSFVFTKAEMILNGILPIDQMRDHIPPTNLITSLIPRHILEDKYGIMLPKPSEDEEPDAWPTAEDLLNAYAFNRGFMTANGQPDNSRAARYILKDYVNGKLLYCHAPSSFDQQEYHIWPAKQKNHSENREAPPRAARAVKSYRMTTNDLDKVFFQSTSQGVHSKGKTGSLSKSEGSSQSENGTSIEKPWKQHNKHKNKAKKEKLRRVYKHLDQH